MEAIINNLIKATGWSIFHSLWQGAIIYGILLFLVSAFPKINARIKHNLAFTALCTMFIGFCITFASIFKMPSATQTFATAPAITADQYQYLLSLPQEISSSTENIFPYLVSVYGVGLLFQIFLLMAGYGKLTQLKRSQRSPVPEEWQLVFNEMVSMLNIRRHISFHLSDKVNVPLVIGYFKPVVLFPFALAAQLDIKQVEAILIHELSHIRRNDYLLNLVKTGIETVLFFNPFVWLSSKFISIEREHACDDLVVKFTGTPVTYAHALLKLEILKDKTSPALSMAATGKNQHLYQRIKRITDMKTNYMNAKQKIFAFALTIATVGSLAWINPAKTVFAADKSKPGEQNIEIYGMDIKSKMLNLPEIKTNPAKQKIQLPADTSKKKKVVKIITVDAKGNKQEYNSVKEMPDSIREEVIRETFLYDNDYSFKFDMDSLVNKSLVYIKSPEFKAQMELVKLNAETMAKAYNIPEFKAQIKLMELNGAKMAEQFNSPQFKKQIKLIELNAKKMEKHFNSPEWKKQQEELMKNSEKLRLKFDSPEWKKQMEEIKELHNSSEYKELREKFDKDLKKLKEKKGIKSDVKTFNFSTGDDLNIIDDQSLEPAKEDVAVNE
ncbi:M56 family metallopeptidase [Pedobacter psychroterrae]|uniref:Peptidase M56 n=1 Tax=Pedobacter psychroterrae TaxID=2530453 RepID=A0A4R0NBS8_9SPHI|nr:M56 family metallopeptidase [Pedobacter psychroterrae]TCC96412.1 peptidase M56 [Pedobacter psychroterrae]